MSTTCASQKAAAGRRGGTSSMRSSGGVTMTEAGSLAGVDEHRRRRDRVPVAVRSQPRVHRAFYPSQKRLHRRSQARRSTPAGWREDPQRPGKLPRADRRGVVAATDSWSSIGIPGDQSGPAFDSRKGFQRILRFGEYVDGHPSPRTRPPGRASHPSFASRKAANSAPPSITDPWPAPSRNRVTCAVGTVPTVS